MERIPCIVRITPEVARGSVAVTVRVPGGGSPLRFTRGTVDERRVQLDAAQQAALRAKRFEVIADRDRGPAGEALAEHFGRVAEGLAARELKEKTSRKARRKATGG
jgi:hypothetical protein